MTWIMIDDDNAEIQIPEALAGYIVYHMTGYLVLVIVKITETKGWRGVRKSNFQSFHPKITSLYSGGGGGG